MATSKLVLIAKTISLFGLSGQIKAYMLAEDRSAYLSLPKVYLGDLKQYSAFKVLKVGLKAKHIVLTLDGLSSPKAALAFSGGSVYCDFAYWPDVMVGKYSYSDLKGLNGKDSAGKSIGKVVDVVNNNGQYLLVLQNQQAEKFLIPWHEGAVIDKTPLEVFFDLPEGLLNL